MVIKRVDEWCPECETEVVLSVYHKKELKKCPNCGAWIFPCSLCREKEMTCDLCELRRDTHDSGRID